MWTCMICNQEKDYVVLRNVLERGTHIPMQVCDDCSSDAEVCEACSVLVTHGQYKTTGDGSSYCKTCYDTFIWECSCCECAYDNRNHSSNTTMGGNEYCDSCWEDECFNCTQCGNSRHEDDRNDNAHGLDICSYCDVPCQPRQIRNYTYKPDPMYFLASPRELRRVVGTGRPFLRSDDGRLLFMGVELELDNWQYGCDPDKLYGQLEEHCSMFYGKRDSSIPNGGWELVTHPCTLAHHRSFGWEYALPALEPHYQLEDNCGIHIHVNRTFFGLEDMSDRNKVIEIKIASFISTTAEHWSTIAERSNTRWGKTKEVYCASDVKEHFLVKDGVRYSAVNFNPRNTIEFRFFRSTFDPDMMFAKLEFIDALCRFVKVTPLHLMCDGKRTWDRFIEYAERKGGKKKSKRDGKAGRYEHLLKEW